MTQSTSRLHIVPSPENPRPFEQFTEFSEAAQQAARGIREHTATTARVSTRGVYLENRPHFEDQRPHHDYDFVAIQLGGGALSVCMEHRHIARGHDHDATVGFERSTLIFQNVTRLENGIEIREHQAGLYRTTAARIYPLEIVTDDAERSLALTRQLAHVLAAVGIKTPAIIEPSTPASDAETETPPITEASQDEALPKAS